MNAIDLITWERSRQIAHEGYATEHDDSHSMGELGDAAAAYILQDQGFGPPDWEESWFKPTQDRIRDLTKAGALIVAEIERLQRVTK